MKKLGFAVVSLTALVLVLAVAAVAQTPANPKAQSNGGR
jgi:hypothetical protein